MDTDKTPQEIDKAVRIELLTNNVKSTITNLKKIEEIGKYFKALEFAIRPVYLTRDEAIEYGNMINEFINIKARELQEYQDELNILKSGSCEG